MVVLHMEPVMAAVVAAALVQAEAVPAMGVVYIRLGNYNNVCRMLIINLAVCMCSYIQLHSMNLALAVLNHLQYLERIIPLENTITVH